MKFFRIFLEILGWLAIAASPRLIFGLIALLIYSETGNGPLSLILLIMGILIGIIWGTKIATKQST